MCVLCVMTVAMVMLFRDFGSYGIIFTTMFVYFFTFLLLLTGNLLFVIDQ
jgi:hypothetical protein